MKAETKPSKDFGFAASPANAQSAYDKAAAHVTSTAAQALHPVHSRATANARRLAEINED
jgi:hypothetical protein